MKTMINDGIPEVHPEEVLKHIQTQDPSVLLIDVRRPEEYSAELGHAQNTQLITMGPDLEDYLQKADKKQKIVFICRSGARSGRTTMISRTLGFTETYNMTGGMILWNQLQLPVEGKNG